VCTQNLTVVPSSRLTDLIIAMDEPPPATHHVLRPHHIGLLAVFKLTFKENLLPPPFILHVIRVLLNEVSEARLNSITNFE
jgi:hypothetical protein